MTLIVGALHWKGVCITCDTRETKIFPSGDKTYNDDALKFALVVGGIGMAAAGNKGVNIIFRSILADILKKDQEKTKYKVTQNPVEYFGSLVMKALRLVPKHPDIKKYCSKDENTRISGLVGGVIPWLSLHIWPDEAKRLIEIMINSKSLNSVYTRHHQEIVECANGQRPYKNFPEFPHSFLLAYRLVIDKNGKPIIRMIFRVPFGAIAAFGSGSKFPIIRYSPRILSWVLFVQKPKEIEYASMHLAQVHGYADLHIKDELGFHFKSFGGGIVPGCITEKGVGIVRGEILSKPDKKVISRIFKYKGQLCIETPKGDKLVLKEFPKVPVLDGIKLIL